MFVDTNVLVYARDALIVASEVFVPGGGIEPPPSRNGGGPVPALGVGVGEQPNAHVWAAMEEGRFRPSEPQGIRAKLMTDGPQWRRAGSGPRRSPDLHRGTSSSSRNGGGPVPALGA